MFRTSTYQPAHRISGTIEAHFAGQLQAARDRGEGNLAHGPSAQAVEAMIDTAFWASLLREEGQSPKISLAYLPPEQAGQALLLERKFPLTALLLTKLAPAVVRPGIHIGVWHEEGQLYVWGSTRAIPALCLVLEVVEPGLLVIKRRRSDGFGKFANVAVLNGDQVKVVDENQSVVPDCPTLLSSLLGKPGPGAKPDLADESTNVLVQLAVSVQAHGRGGTLLVVPTGTDAWRGSIIHPITYAVKPVFSGLGNLLRQEPSQKRGLEWHNTLGRAIESVAGLTAVDGAALISDQYDLLAFGAKIRVADGQAPLEKIVVTEPVVGYQARYVHPAQHGGTRHMSAAQFVYDQRDSLALVASQDGRFTVFSWSPCENMVQAHRIDALLL